jgi:pimeloyl-ACP methyl ester carboxylesterase
MEDKLVGQRRPPLWPLALGAATLGAAALVQERSRHAERSNPPLGTFLTVGGVQLHYVERGEGEPLVLLHGNATGALDFLLSEVVSKAARQYRVIVFDRPGYGYSQRPRDGADWGPEAQADLLHEALVQIGAARAIVLGHSWGAMVALALALAHPESVRGLVLLAGYYYPTLRPDVPFAAIPAIPVLGDLLRFTFSPLVARATWPLAVKAMFAPAEVPEHFWRFPAWLSVRPSQLRASAAEAAEMIPAAARLSKRYQDLAVPPVIVAGSKDRVASSARHSGRLHSELRRSRLRMIDGIGHMVHHLAPDAVLGAIAEAPSLSLGPRSASSIRVGDSRQPVQ